MRVATAADIPALHALIESAFRGEPSLGGWTSEAHLLDGQRTDTALLAEMIADPAQTILLAEETDALPGCVLVVDRGADAAAYLGMLSVAPGRQGGGLGSVLTRAAEEFARRLGRPAIEMRVILQRPELIAWYERCGYADTGRREPFPYGDERFGMPRRDDLEFVVLRKNLTGP